MGSRAFHIVSSSIDPGTKCSKTQIRFYSTVDLVNLLEQEKTAGRAGKLTFALMRIDWVILDELG
jgi:DNA replication protein DnaC